jgi:hypothetical protein
MTGPLFHVLKMVRDIELLVLEALDHLTSYSFLKVLLALTHTASTAASRCNDVLIDSLKGNQSIYISC